ncbi:hypothetical protein [Nakamurella endophytica]|uniref:Uncharacterized protein n=1 Tax=Nakamurella endophytica TaxID=1748367 RepID=A0A917WN86_9ACTN|nr:hypothetical protein [Nakamurella endophytica]GGM15944.1 hypothetical protein GCM10011594_39930 [Nakamurella endophytica]
MTAQPKTITALATVTVLGGVLLTGCGGSNTPAPPTVDRTNPRAVADAFANAWAAGDLATACSFTTTKERAALTSQSLCTGSANWSHQTPRASQQTCTYSNGSVGVIYTVDQPVNRFLIFEPGLIKRSDGSWAVDSLAQHDPGEVGSTC